MSKSVQIIRGTSEQNDNYIGPEGSLSYDTDNKCIRAHDGSSGGTIIPNIDMVFKAIFPDYTKKVSMTSPFTAPTYGYAMWNNGGPNKVYVNDQEIAVAGNDSYNEGPALVLLTPGDIIRFSADTGLREFYPCHGL